MPRLNFIEAKQKLDELKKAIAQTYLQAELLTSKTPETQKKLEQIQNLLREAMECSADLEPTSEEQPTRDEVKRYMRGE